VSQYPLICGQKLGSPEASNGVSLMFLLRGLTQLNTYLSNTKRFKLVCFITGTCLPCEDLIRELEKLEREISNNMTFFLVNIEENISEAEKFGIPGVPYTQIYDEENNKVCEVLGINLQDLLSCIKKLTS